MSAFGASEKSVAADMDRAHGKPKIGMKFASAPRADVKLLCDAHTRYEKSYTADYQRRDRNNVPRHIVLLVKPIHFARGQGKHRCKE